MGGSGAGSGGGGGSSGTIDYPAYMKERHSALYDSIKDAVAKAQSSNPYNYVQAWDPSYSMYKMEIIAKSWYNFYDKLSPMAIWECIAGQVPNKIMDFFTPEEFDEIMKMGNDPAEARKFEGSVGTPAWTDVFSPARLRDYLQRIPLDYVWDNTAINEYLSDAAGRLCETARDEVIPQYRRGMQDIGAVMTSAYKIGEALLWHKVMTDAKEMQSEITAKVVEKEKDAKIALAMSAYETAGKLALTEYEKRADYEILRKEYVMKYVSARADMMAKYGLLYFEQVFKSTSDVLNLTLQKIGWINQMMHYYLEVERMTYTAMKEYTDSKNIYKIEQTKWDLEMFKYQMDALGSIASSAGTSYTTSSSGTSRLSSAIGGALTGASAGMMAGAAMGSAGGPIGAAVGGAIGLIGGIL